MKEKFTPGEWEIEDQREMDTVYDYAIVDDDGWFIAHIENCTRLEEQEANAYLLAAAPKMYQRLQSVKTYLWALSVNPAISQHTKECIEIMIKNIEDDLKKARGER